MAAGRGGAAVDALSACDAAVAQCVRVAVFRACPDGEWDCICAAKWAATVACTHEEICVTPLPHSVCGWLCSGAYLDGG